MRRRRPSWRRRCAMTRCRCSSPVADRSPMSRRRLRLEPTECASRMTVIWIGGGDVSGWRQWEYNANHRFGRGAHGGDRTNRRARSGKYRRPTYRQMQISIAEMGADMKPISPFTQWLYSIGLPRRRISSIWAGHGRWGTARWSCSPAFRGESSRFHDPTGTDALGPRRHLWRDGGGADRCASMTAVDVRLTHADFPRQIAPARGGFGGVLAGAWSGVLSAGKRAR